jgi:hypothetical protein
LFFFFFFPHNSWQASKLCKNPIFNKGSQAGIELGLSSR